MSLSRFLRFGSASAALTVLIVRLDTDVSSFADLARWENVPALVAYSGVTFGFMLLGSKLLGRLPSRRATD